MAGRQKFTIYGNMIGESYKQLKFIEMNQALARKIESLCKERGTWVKLFGTGYVISPDFLESLGPDSTDEFLGDIPFGGDRSLEIKNRTDYINKERINDLRRIESQYFDLSKLLILCTCALPKIQTI